MVTIQSVCGGGSKGLYNASRCALWKINPSSMFANLSHTCLLTLTHTYRSALCTHLQCFDASVYLQMNEKWVFKGSFPVCPLPQYLLLATNTGSASNARCKGLAPMARFFVSGLQSLAYMCTLMVMNLWVVRIQNLSIYLVLGPLSMWPWVRG